MNDHLFAEFTGKLSNIRSNIEQARGQADGTVDAVTAALLADLARFTYHATHPDRCPG